MSIGDKIRELRNEHGLTQEQLAKKCNLSKNAIWNYEKGKRTPNIEVLSTIANALEITISELLSNNELETHNENNIYSKTYIAENTLKDMVFDLKHTRFKNGIGLKKVAKVLNVDDEILLKIENENIPNADIAISYGILMDDLLKLRKSLIYQLIDFGIFDDHNDIDLGDLLQLSKDQYIDFVSSVRRYIKFALEEAKQTAPSINSNNSIVSIKEMLHKKPSKSEK